jgi:hypothetical protein
MLPTWGSSTPGSNKSGTPAADHDEAIVESRQHQTKIDEHAAGSFRLAGIIFALVPWFLSDSLRKWGPNRRPISPSQTGGNIMRLRRNEYCPIDRSFRCCGREPTNDYSLGFDALMSPHHPRGYRELRSPAERRDLLKRKVSEQNRICAICHHEFTELQ